MYQPCRQSGSLLRRKWVKNLPHRAGRSSFVSCQLQLRDNYQLTKLLRWDKFAFAHCSLALCKISWAVTKVLYWKICLAYFLSHNDYITVLQYPNQRDFVINRHTTPPTLILSLFLIHPKYVGSIYCWEYFAEQIGFNKLPSLNLFSKSS